MPKHHAIRRAIWALAITTAAFSAQAVAAVPAPIAVYQFGGTLASSVAGTPALQAVDPLNRGGFVQDVVDGVSRTVYSFGGTTTPSAQGGLSLDVSGILAGKADQYSVEIVFKFTENDGRWRRILDVQDRQSDNGFYVDPGNRLNIYPVSSGTGFTTNAYHDVFLVNNQGTATYYLDNGAATTSNTSVMNIQNGRMNFFLDNVVAGGQGEYASGSVALIRIYDSALTAPPPPVPEPATWALLGGGLALLLARKRASATR
jgi:hypothetical protein